MYNIIKSPKNNMDFQMTKNNRNIPPGLMQYKIKPQDIINININSIKKRNNIIYNYDNLSFVPHTKDNLDKLTPDTKTGNANKWKIIFILKSRDSVSNRSCLKGALQNKNNGEIALMTSIDENESKIYKYRVVNSMNSKFKVCQCKMIAPLIFWYELKNRLLY